MFAYLLIGLELLILFSVFWYVFIREPKPFQVSHSGYWGSYETKALEFSQADLDTLVMEYKQNAHKQVAIDRRVPRFANPHIVRDFDSDFRDPSLTNDRALFIMKTRIALNKKSNPARSRKAAEFGWVINVPAKPSGIYSRAMAKALCWFENLCVKVP